MKKTLTLILVIGSLFNVSFAATRTASASGNWNSGGAGGIWTGAAAPIAGDIVIIPTGKSVVISANAACASVSITGTGNLTFSNAGSYTLTITGNYSNSGASVAGNGFGTLICAGTTTISGTTTSIFENITINSGATLTAHSSSTQIEGNFTNDGTFNHNNGTLIVNGFMDMFGTTTSIFKNIIINVGGTFRCRLNSNTQIEGDITNNATFADRGSTVIFNGTSTIYGTQITVFNHITINSTKTLIAHATVQTQFKGNFVNNGTFTHNSGTVTFAGIGTVSGSSISTFNNLAIANTCTLTGYAGNMNVAGNWTASGTAVYNHNSGTVTFTGTSTVLGTATTSFNNVIVSSTLTGHATNMNIAGDFTNNGTYTHNNGTVTFNGTSTIGGSSGSSFNNITINAASTLTGYSANMNVAGNFINNGTYTHNSGTVTFNGTTTVSGTATTGFNNLTITGTLTGHSSSMNVAGNWINNGTYNHNSSTVVFNGASAVTGSSTTSFYSLTINAASSLTGHSGNMNIAGNWLNNNTYTHNNGTVTFNGAVSQLIGGTVGSSFYKMTMDNNNTGAVLGQSINVSNNLTMTDGDINLSGNNIELGLTGNLVSETNAKRVYGTSGEIRATRSIAALTLSNVAGLGASILTSVTAITSITIERGHGQQVGWSNTSPVARYYDITTTPATGLLATLTFEYFDSNELNGESELDELNFILYRSTDGGTIWQPKFLSVPNPLLNTVTFAAIDAFSRWTVSNKVLKPLPISLLDFKAKQQDNNVLVNWKTASEFNNDYFSVERSADGKLFNELNVINVSANSSSIKSYQIIDNQPLNGISYYRLKQTDLDGNYTYSNIETVEFAGTTNYSAEVFPNPSANDKLYLNLSGFENKVVSVNVSNALGAMEFEKTIDISDNIFIMDIANYIHLPKGIHFLNVQADSRLIKKKLVIQ